MVTLLRDVAGDGAQKAANKVNPDQSALDNIDEPAQDNQWHDVPDLSKDNLKNQAKSKYDANKPFDKNDLREARDDARGTAQQHGDSRDGILNGAKRAADNLQSKAERNVPDDKQDEAQNKKDRLKDYAKDKMPQERREQIIYRLKKMVVEIQGHKDYQSAIDTLLYLAEEYKGHTKNLASQTTQVTQEAHQTDDGINRAESDLKTLIERFANHTSLDDLFDGINAIYRDAERDPEFKGWLKHMDSFIKKSLKEQGYLLKDSSTEEWNKLYDQGDYLINDRYQDHFQRIIDETKFLSNEFDKDPQNRSFADAMKKLFLDLGNDKDGKPTFKPHLVSDLSNVIIPAMFENIRYVPIPRIEYSDPMADAIIENLIIEGDNLAPNVFEFGNDNYFRWGRKTTANKNKNKVMLSVSGIQMDLKDVSYYVKKKHGFPSLSDTGVMDIFLGGSGFSFKLALETADNSDRSHFFKVNKVDVDIQHMNIRLKQSKHKLLFALVKPLLLKVMRPILQKVIEKLIKDKINQADGFAYGIKKEVDRAQAEAVNNPDQIGNIYQRYFNAAQQKLAEGKQKKAELEEKAADKHVNMAITQQDSMFKNVRLPGGISTKATEYKELAAKGNKWESPIFSLGSASPSSNIPGAQQIKRKHHNTAPSQVRGPDNIGQGTDAYSKAGESNSFGASEKYTGGHPGYDGSNSYQQGQGQGYGSSQQQYSSGQQYSGSSPSYGQEYGNSSSYGNNSSSAAYSQPTAAYSQPTENYGVNFNSSDPSNAVPTTTSGNVGSHTTLGLQNPVLTGNV
jgi:hypothetical protein